MSEVDQPRTVFHQILKNSWAYDFVQKALGTDRVKRTVVDQGFEIQRPVRILDIGSGTSDILNFIPGQRINEYWGVDVNLDHIQTAIGRFGFRPELKFLCHNLLQDSTPLRDQKFDLIYLGGVTHHLNDQEVGTILSIGQKVLNQDGRLVTMDPGLHAKQSWLARKSALNDRGKFVRTDLEIEQLLRSHFQSVQLLKFENLIRIPQTTFISICR